LANTSISGSVTLAQNTPVTTALLPVNNLTRIDNDAAPGGTFTGTLACTLTFGGATQAFTRSLSLDVLSGSMIVGATSINVNLGSQGIVTLSVPADTTIGFDSSWPNGTVLDWPLIADTTLLLVIPSPTITNIWPTSGPVGTSVTITGTGFGSTQGASTVAFGGVLATAILQLA